MRDVWAKRPRLYAIGGAVSPVDLDSVGAGAIGAVIGVIGSVFLAIFAVIWYPVKRMLKARKKSASADSKTQAK